MEAVNLSQANHVYLNKNASTNAQTAPISNAPKFNSDLKQDTVELSTKKVKPNKKAKVALFSALGVVLAVGAGILIKKRIDYSKLKPLAEFIEFKPAQTMDEAIEFAKKNFGIEKFDFGEDLELANWANKGLTNLNNKAKGKIHMPKSLCLDASLDKTIGGNCNMAGEIKINPYEFDYEANIEELNVLFDQFNKGTIGAKGFLASKQSLLELYQVYKFKKANPNYQFSRMEAYKLNCLIQDIKTFSEYPMQVLRAITQDDAFIKACKDKNIEIDLDKLSKLSKEKQSTFISDVLGELELLKLKDATLYPKRNISEFDTLYHEMGHLQHFKNASLFSHIFGKLSDEPKQIAKFANNPTAQKIASKVSWYAQTQPSEFVAEVYAKLCNGVKFDDETMKLYKKLGGVLI